MTPVGVPVVLRDFFDGHDLERKQNLAAEVLTVTEDGWPHAAMVSAGEVLLTGKAGVRLALWPASRTTANVVRTGRAVLLVVLGGGSYRLRLSLAEVRPEEEGGPLTFFTGTVVDVSEDRAKYATLKGGLEFSLLDAGTTLARWADTTRMLRRLPAGE
ncbi:MAG: pyridoxamine 5'-phosphate oxidase family protein [Actinomycetota bacterium]|nr:pyridoxamine 5'-phosphate oxidase family protein [Actinomycetota bacterium]